MDTQTVRFIRRGELVSLPNVPPSRTLLEVLREDLGCSGTKEGCNEGDCGACTVVLGELVAGRLKYSAINSCIRFAHAINGMALWTVEDIAVDPLIKPSRADGGLGAAGAAGLHPAQQAMVDCHGSQCGFCTPGFVMSMFGMYQNHVCHFRPISRELAQEELSGNLCRCTGYRPILDAAQQMAKYPTRRVDEAALAGKLRSLHRLPVRPTGPSYLMPRTLSELLQARSQHPQAQLVAGCTDVGLWVTKMHMQFEQVLDLTQTAELLRIETYPHHVAIGAAVSLTDAYAALVQDRPQLKAFANRFAGLPTRNAGTLGGNVANGSPIGDSMPLLIALRASVVLMSWRQGRIQHRELALEQLYIGYRKSVIAPDEVLAWVKVPKPTPHPHPNPLPPAGEGEVSQTPSLRLKEGAASQSPSPHLQEGAASQTPSLRLQEGAANRSPSPHRGEGWGEGQEWMRVYKISKRFDDDISAVCLALNLDILDGKVQRASIGAGGVAATPARATRTEALLTGQTWNQKTVNRAIACLREEFQPISDMRASAGYRSQVLGNLLQRFWLETQGIAGINLECPPEELV